MTKAHLQNSKVLVACASASDAAPVAKALGEWSELRTSFVKPFTTAALLAKIAAILPS